MSATNANDTLRDALAATKAGDLKLATDAYRRLAQIAELGAYPDASGWVRESEDTRTMKDLARNALDSQTASNLSGIVYAFSRDMKRLRKLEPNQGTHFYNTHPICVMYATQISHLTSCEADEAYRKASDFCSSKVAE